jgi:hypothetical protein
MIGLADSRHVFSSSSKEAVKMMLVSPAQGTAKGLKRLLLIEKGLVSGG